MKYKIEILETLRRVVEIDANILKKKITLKKKGKLL